MKYKQKQIVSVFVSNILPVNWPLSQIPVVSSETRGIEIRHDIREKLSFSCRTWTWLARLGIEECTTTLRILLQTTESVYIDTLSAMEDWQL